MRTPTYTNYKNNNHKSDRKLSTRTTGTPTTLTTWISDEHNSYLLLSLVRWSKGASTVEVQFRYDLLLHTKITVSTCWHRKRIGCDYHSPWLEWRNTLFSTLSSLSLARFTVTVLPAVEKRRSEDADVTWTARYFLARQVLPFLCTTHLSPSMVEGWTSSSPPRASD